MFVRDHARVEFHKALGVDPTDYDFEVFRVTSDISRQVFPVTLDIDHPAFRSGLDRLVRIADGIAAARRQGGVLGNLKRAGLVAAAAATLARLFVLPPKSHPLPTTVRLSPAW